MYIKPYLSFIDVVSIIQVQNPCSTAQPSPSSSTEQPPLLLLLSHWKQELGLDH